MSTTDLFVELLVIGLGAAVWVLLLILSIFGIDWFTFEQLTSVTVLVPALGFVYVLGIVTDRAADAIFDRYFKLPLKRLYYSEGSDQDFRDRRYVYVKSEYLTSLLEYGRSRLRICRGWCFNGVLIIIALNIFAWSQLSTSAVSWRLSIYGTLLMGVLVWGAWRAWRQLILDDYRKIKEQAADLRRFLGDKEVYETKVAEVEQPKPTPELPPNTPKA